jgi:hypothetical protein
MIRALCARKEHTIQNTVITADFSTGQFYHEGEKIATTSDKTTGTFTRRIGSTTYRVGVHFSGSSRETANDKILRLIQNEAASGKAAGL